MPDYTFVWNEALVKEATTLHDVPKDRLIITGAPPFDFWFELQPSLGEAWVNLGMLALQDAKWEDAEEYLSNAMDAGALLDRVGYALGVARMNLQDLTGAEEVWRQNMRDWPLHADTYIALGSLLERQGRIREAISIYENGRMAIPGDGRFGNRLRALRPPPSH